MTTDGIRPGSPQEMAALLHVMWRIAVGNQSDPDDVAYLAREEMAEEARQAIIEHWGVDPFE